MIERAHDGAVAPSGTRTDPNGRGLLPASMWVSLLLLAAGAAGSTALGFVLGAPWLLPILGATAAYPVYAADLARGRPARAVTLMVIWAVMLSVAVVFATSAFPSRAERTIWLGTEYAAEMIEWIETGIGPEGDPSLFLPQHGLHFALFNLACLASAGLGGLVMGAALLNYMNFYVAVLIREASNPILAAALGWPPWAILRVMGFILVSVPLSARLLRRFRRGRTQPNISYWKYYLWGAGLVVSDAILKAVLAPFWRGLLARAL